jgi:hypothetical protein
MLTRNSEWCNWNTTRPHGTVLSAATVRVCCRAKMRSTSGRGHWTLECDREEPALNADFIGFLHFVRWARQKGYGPAGVSGLIP